MNKLQMAHDWVMNFGDSEYPNMTIEKAWDYADAMQAEADKRKSSEFPNVLRGACGEIVAVKVDDMEWQPDWSQAPDWAVAWTIDSAECLWWSYIPWFKNNFWFVDDSISWKCDDAPNFGYKGDWRDSLRKRP